MEEEEVNDNKVPANDMDVEKEEDAEEEPVDLAFQEEVIIVGEEKEEQQ